MKKQHKSALLWAAGLSALAVIAGCASLPGEAELDAQAAAMMKTSFRTQGIADVKRIEQDLGQKACSSDQPPSESVAKQIEAESLASIKWPANGQYIGDWKEGEKLAQNGRGMTWTEAHLVLEAVFVAWLGINELRLRSTTRPGETGQRRQAPDAAGACGNGPDIIADPLKEPPPHAL